MVPLIVYLLYLSSAQVVGCPQESKGLLFCGLIASLRSNAQPQVNSRLGMIAIWVKSTGKLEALRLSF